MSCAICWIDGAGMKAPPNSATAGFRRTAIWLVPLVAGLHWLLLLRPLAVPAWFGGVMLLAAGIFGAWLRRPSRSFRSVLWSSCVLSAYLGFEVLGRAMWHLYALLSGRSDLVWPASVIFLAACGALVGVAFARGVDPAAVLVTRGDCMDRVSAASADAGLMSVVGGALSVVVVGVARPYLQSDWWQLLVFVGAPLLMATLSAAAIGRTMALLRHVAVLEAARGSRFLAPVLR